MRTWHQGRRTNRMRRAARKLFSPRAPFVLSPSPPSVDSHHCDPGEQTAARGLRGRDMRREYNVLALIKGNERYVFVYDDETHEALIDVLRDSAADPLLSFTWFDAAVLTEKAREQADASEQAEADVPPSRSR